MSFQFRKAVLESTNVLVAFAGPSGCGKTFSSLRLARGLVGDTGKIAFIDTESRRALHYAKKFEFDHLELGPPYRPQRIQEAVLLAEQEKYGAIIIDSMSHEHDGIGGLIEWAETLELAGTKSPGNWKESKRAHRHLVNTLLNCKAHLIFCLRADERIKIEKHPDTGKTIVVPQGWVPVCEKRFMYDMIASFLMTPNAPGIPQPVKLQDQHAKAFPLDKQVGESAGKFLAAWANSGTGVRASLSFASLDGEITEMTRASEWLDAFRAQLTQAQDTDTNVAWDLNKDVLYRIEEMARNRKDPTQIEAVAAVARLGLSRLQISEPLERI